MAPKPKTKEQIKNDPIQISKRIEEKRKLTQQEHSNQFETEKEELKELIKENEGPDI
jgi:hypothetical protein